jgi:ATP-binding cassette subfamily B protein
MFASLKLGLIARYLRPQRKQLIKGGLALLVVNLLGTALPLLVQKTVNSLTPGFSLTNLLHQALWIALLASAMAGVRLWSRVLVFGAGRQVEVLLRQRIFDHLLKQEPGWVQSAGSGEVISRSTSDVENVRRLLGFAVLSLANTALAYAFTLPAMLAIDPWLSLAAIVLYPLMLVIVGASGSRMMSQQRQQQQNLAELSDLIQEDLSGISAIKIYGQEATEVGAFASLSRRYRDAAIALARTRSILFPLLEGISSLSLLVLLALGSGQLERGSLSLGGLIALILYIERLVFPTALLGFTLSSFQTGQVSLERVEDLLSRESRIQNPSQPIELKLDPEGATIEARNLTVRYPGAQRNSLEDLNFQIKSGELVAVVGPVGSGKTTLARALGRMLEIPDGQLFLNKQDITSLNLNDLRKQIAMVPQEGYLFSATLAENLSYGNPNASLESLDRVVQQAQLKADLDGFPDRYQTIVGERGITLSGGQRQRSSLARALLVDTPLLVLDDALASVDNRTAAAILQSLTINLKRTVLFISHQLSTAAACDRVLVIVDGRLVQEGTHRKLLAEEGTYRKLWEREKANTELEAAA